MTRKPSATADERRLYLAYRSIEHKQAQADLMVSHPDVYWALVHWFAKNGGRVGATLVPPEELPGEATGVGVTIRPAVVAEPQREDVA